MCQTVYSARLQENAALLMLRLPVSMAGGFGQERSELFLTCDAWELAGCVCSGVCRCCGELLIKVGLSSGDANDEETDDSWNCVV